MTCSYGSNGRLVTVTDNRGTTTLSYEPNSDRLSSITDPVTGVISYTYGDSWGNLTQVVQDPGTGHLARTTTMQYDVGGRVSQSTDPNGRTSTFTYNLLGQPLTATFPSTPSTPVETITYTYGGNGRLSTVADNRGTTTLAYEAACDRVASVTDPVTGTLSYTYKVGGGRLSMTLPGGNTWTYGYPSGGSGNPALFPQDAPNSMSDKLSSLTDDAGRKVDYSLDTLGTLRWAKFNQTYSGGALVSYCQTDYTYDYTGPVPNDTHYWLTKIKNTWNWKVGSVWNQQVRVQYAYTYNNAGMRLTNAVSDAGGPVRTETYGYDELYRLTSVNYGDGQTQSYTFDPMGNRASKTDAGGGINGTENYTYNAANMLLTRGAASYTNDTNGNTLTGGGRTNSWDSQNRLRQCIFSGTTTTHTYGMDGIRHRTVNGANTTDYVLDGPMFVRELLNGAVNATYLVGPRGPEYRRDSAGTVRWYLYDGLGSCSGEVDPSGNITASRKFDVYGSVRSTTGTSTTKHKFVGKLGHPSEDETGMIYMRARYMDPVTGRFISEDPAQNGANWFCYCDNSPTNKHDPTGRDGEEIDIGAGWWIRIDKPRSGSLPNERDLHWGNRSGDLGSIFEGGTWKHNKGNLPTNRVKKAAGRAGWLGVLEVISVVAYFEQNPLDCIAILLDCAGEFEMANRVDALNNSL